MARDLQARAIRVDPKSYAVGQIMDMIEKGELVLPTGSQRYVCWDTPLQSKLIESLLLRIPIGTFYFDENRSGVWRVMDGVQRLYAIYDCINLNYQLEGLEYFPELNSRAFNTLMVYQQRRIRETGLYLQVVYPTVPKEERIDIFKRIHATDHDSSVYAADRLKYLGLL